MQMPAPLTGPPDLQVSEAATPGASVAAVRGEHDHVLETPEFDTPGQASPGRLRSLEGGRSLGDGGGLDSSRGRSGGLHAAAAAALADAVAAPAAAAEPLSKPRLRVQGADIILEDAASPKDAAENGGGAAPRPPQEQQQLGAAAAAPGQAAGAAAGGGGAGAGAPIQQPAAPPALPQQAQQQAQQHVQPPPLNLAAAMRVSQTHEHELQLRLASRTATGVSNMAIASTRPPVTHPLPHADDRCAAVALSTRGDQQPAALDQADCGCTRAQLQPCCLLPQLRLSWSHPFLVHSVCPPQLPSWQALPCSMPPCEPCLPCTPAAGCAGTTRAAAAARRALAAAAARWRGLCASNTGPL